VRDAEAQREVDEKSDAEEQTSPPAQETIEAQAPEVDKPAPKKRKQGRRKGYNTPKAEIERQEQIKEAMEYRLIGYTYRQIAEQMNVAPSTAYKWVAEGLAEITQETAEELRRVMFEQCHQIMQKLMPLVDETAPRDVIDSILKVQDRQMKLAGMLQGAGISLTIGKPSEGNSDEDIVVRIKADAPVLRPDEPVPARPVL
jgi:transposase